MILTDLQIYDLDREDQIYILEDGIPVFKLHKSMYYTQAATARAAMARSSESQSHESTDKSVGVTSITITGPLLNSVDVKEHKAIIETAKEGGSIVATP